MISPVSVLKQYKQPVEQKELDLQVMSKASRTVPDGGEMLHEGASVAAGSVGSGPGIGKVYLAKPGSHANQTSTNRLLHTQASDDNINQV